MKIDTQWINQESLDFPSLLTQCLGLGDLQDAILLDLPTFDTLCDPCPNAGSVYLSSTRGPKAEERKAGIWLTARTSSEFLSPPESQGLRGWGLAPASGSAPQSPHPLVGVYPAIIHMPHSILVTSGHQRLESWRGREGEEE